MKNPSEHNKLSSDNEPNLIISQLLLGI